MQNGERKFVSMTMRQSHMDLMRMPLDHVNKMMLDKAAQYIAQELIQGGTIRLEPTPTGRTDYTEFRVDLKVMPVTEHNKAMSSLNTENLALIDHVRVLQRQLQEAQQKIKEAKGALA